MFVFFFVFLSLCVCVSLSVCLCMDVSPFIVQGVKGGGCGLGHLLGSLPPPFQHHPFWTQHHNHND